MFNRCGRKRCVHSALYAAIPLRKKKNSCLVSATPQIGETQYGKEHHSTKKDENDEGKIEKKERREEEKKKKEVGLVRVVFLV